ncbi:substrate-binding domain-containing protein [Fluviicola sp.]|jgi:phosphate transport system substrate-binding protein|uniref:PstS family phosphate ABC transporter substrate-binding protein n=1 Tax=Fluviicola sp. TaxID=1917219 RepID=UPI002817E75D|nr:substrate-binding domain-containing protein [Fluviicola sp.]MDR0801331.1 substrate-binding domain-containing protein [Fluviicola sp.]
MKQFHIFLALVGSGILFSACDNASKTKDTPRRGQKTFYADESFQPLMETSSYTFMGIYPDAKLDFVYTGETAAMNAMSQGKTRTIFVSRDFTDKEKKSLHASNIQVESGVFAHDAVTFIINPGNNDTLLTQDQLKNILTGKSTTWPFSNKPIEVVFDRVQSANFNFMLKWLGNASYGKVVHATRSTKELIQYVQNHPLTLGVIGYNFISDLDDPAVKKRLKQFKVVAIQGEEGSYWRPNKATITEKKYPFHREIWYINSGAPDGLNSGFINFLNGRQGQLLLEKCELGPGKGTPREINFITE